MKVTTARLLVAAAIAGTALLSLNSAFAAGTHAGDDYGYVHSATDAYTDGARKIDAFSDGARKIDAFSDGARTVFQDYPFGFAV